MLRLPTQRAVSQLVKPTTRSYTPYRRFPATLYRVQPRRVSELGQWDPEHQDGWGQPDTMCVSSDGLVRPGKPHPKYGYPLSVLHGAELDPITWYGINTIDMRQTSYYEEFEEGLLPPGSPHPRDLLLVAIETGTVLPEHLTLGYEWDCYFALEPTHPMTLQDFNHALTEFYRKNAIFYNLGRWLINYNATFERGDPRGEPSMPETWMNSVPEKLMGSKPEMLSNK